MEKCTKCNKETNRQYTYYKAQEIVGQSAKPYQNHRSRGQIVTTEYRGIGEEHAFVCAWCNYWKSMLRSFIVLLVLLVISWIFVKQMGIAGNNLIWLLVTLLAAGYYFLHFLYCGFLLLTDRHHPEMGAEAAIRYKHGSPKNDQGIKIYFTPYQRKQLKSPQ